MSEVYPVPPSRTAFRKSLERTAQSRAWYSVDALYLSIVLRGEYFVFCDPTAETSGLFLKGERLIIGEHQFESDDYDRSFQMRGRVREAVLGLPLFKAYCYLLAILGVVEIKETEPEKALTKNEKKVPISPYDAAQYVRLTEFGAWCLDLSKDKPEKSPVAYEAIADKELLLVTFKGHSLERKLFLDAVGEKLGEERYRVTEASFIRGCERASDIKDRIKKFKTLIDPKPSARWEEYFSTVIARAGLFSKAEPAVMFTLPADPVLARVIIQDTQLRALIIRAEGNRVVIRATDHRKFLKALAAKGFFNEDW